MTIMNQQSESWLLDTIRAIITGDYSIEGKHRWTLSNENQKKVLTCTSLSTGERVYQAEITDTSIPAIEMVLDLDHVITAYRHEGRFYSKTHLYSKTFGEWSYHMTINTPL